MPRSRIKHRFTFRLPELEISVKDELRKQILSLVDEYNELCRQEGHFEENLSIPPSGKVISGKERRYMVDAALDAWLTTGRFNTAFEKSLSSYLGC